MRPKLSALLAMDVSLFSDTVCFCIYFFLEEGIIFVEYYFCCCCCCCCCDASTRSPRHFHAVIVVLAVFSLSDSRRDDKKTMVL
jgi:hypothetical protein